MYTRLFKAAPFKITLICDCDYLNAQQHWGVFTQRNFLFSNKNEIFITTHYTMDTFHTHTGKRKKLNSRNTDCTIPFNKIQKWPK